MFSKGFEKTAGSKIPKSNRRELARHGAFINRRGEVSKGAFRSAAKQKVSANIPKKKVSPSQAASAAMTAAPAAKKINMKYVIPGVLGLGLAAYGAKKYRDKQKAK